MTKLWLSRLQVAASDDLSVFKYDIRVPAIEEQQRGNRGHRIRRQAIEYADDMRRVIWIPDRKKERVSRIPVLFSTDTKSLRLQFRPLWQSLVRPDEYLTRSRST